MHMQPMRPLLLSLATLSVAALTACGDGAQVQSEPVVLISLAHTDSDTVSRDRESMPAETLPSAPAAPPHPELDSPQPAPQATNLEGSYFERFDRLVADGNTHALFETAMMLYHGIGGAEHDREEGRMRLEQAAQAGSLTAMSRLGEILLGEGDRDNAMHWFVRAAEMGDPDGVRNAAYLFAYEDDGRTLVSSTQDVERAKAYLKPLIELGDFFSMALLGGIYLDKGDFVNSEPLLRRAAQSGLFTATVRYHELAQKIESVGLSVRMDASLLEQADDANR